MAHEIEEEFIPALTTLVGWVPHFKVNSFAGLPERILDQIRTGYLRDRIPYMSRALGWAVLHPLADFAALLPGTRYTNDQIFKCLVVLRNQFILLEAEVDKKI